MARNSDGDGDLFVTDAVIGKRLGLTAGETPAVLSVLEKDGFPRRNPLFNDRRYWPAVRAFFDATEIGHITMRNVPASSARSRENWGETPRRSDRSKEKLS